MSAEIEDLRDRNARLKRENAALRAEVVAVRAERPASGRIIWHTLTTLRSTVTQLRELADSAEARATRLATVIVREAERPVAAPCIPTEAAIDALAATFCRILGEAGQDEMGEPVVAFADLDDESREQDRRLALAAYAAIGGQEVALRRALQRASSALYDVTKHTTGPVQREAQAALDDTQQAWELSPSAAAAAVQALLEAARALVAYSAPDADGLCDPPTLKRVDALAAAVAAFTTGGGDDDAGR